MRIVALMMAGVVGGGCVASPDRARTWDWRADFPDGESTPRVAVYGDLGDLLAGYDVTPPIERFLYGPNDYGKTVLRNPQGMALLGDQLLVCDQGHVAVIAIHLGTGRSITWGDPDHCPRCPVDVTTTPDGRVFVADTTLRSILVFDANERFVAALSPGEADDRAFRPCAVFVHGDILYVGNGAGRRIDRWNMARGEWLAPFCPPPGEPALIAPTGICMTRDGVLVVVDAVEGRLCRVTVEGQWLSGIGRAGRSAGEFVRPKQVCCTSSGLILVTDAGRQSVLVFDDSGGYVTEVYGDGEKWEGWTLPAGLIAMSLSDLSPLTREGANAPAAEPDGYVVVSDSLGKISLTLLGIFTEPPSPGGGQGR